MNHRFWKGNGPMSVLIDDLEEHGSGDIRLAEVRLHLSAAGGAGNFTITMDSLEGVEYDAILSSTDMTALQDKDYAPDNPPRIRATDALKLEWANAGAKTWGLEVIYCPAGDY